MDAIYRNYDKAITFCSDFLIEGSADWTDGKGIYEIVIGNDVSGLNLSSCSFREIFISKDIQDYLNFNNIHFRKYDGSTEVLSIGSFETHNEAKLFCYNHNLELTTVPVPLANDSFGTNRISLPGAPSIECSHPVKTIFDINLINSLPFNINILGVGEFLSLFTSVIDFYSVKSQEIPSRILEFINDIANRLLNTSKEASKEIIHLIASALLFKVLIMRSSPDYQIGCGVDHILAGYFEKKLKMPHGKAVYIGTWISMLLFPEWQKYGLSFLDIESYGIRIGIITPRDLDKVASISVSEMLCEACKMRPARHTNISPTNLTEIEIRNFQNRLAQYREKRLWETSN